MRQGKRGNGVGEGGHEDRAGELRLVQHVVGLREDAHRAAHVARTADARVDEGVLVGRERQGLPLSGSTFPYADPVVVFLPSVRAQRRVLLGVGDSVQVDQVVRVARFLRLTVNHSSPRIYLRLLRGLRLLRVLRGRLAGGAGNRDFCTPRPTETPTRTDHVQRVELGCGDTAAAVDRCRVRVRARLLRGER